jgi:addiction module RelE/StbE family toxin
MLVKFSKDFGKCYQKADLKIKLNFDKRLQFFAEKPFHPQLHNHLLTGKYSGFRSINITGDWRAIFSVHIDNQGNQTVIFELLGTHSQLYK